MKFTTSHQERWHLDIVREEGDNWPAVPLKYRRDKAEMHPDKITVILNRGANHACGLVQGRLIKKDGTPGRAEASESTYGSSLTDRFPWTAEIVEGARTAAGLGPGSTGCGW